MAGGTTSKSLGGLSAHLDTVGGYSKGFNVRLKTLDGRAILFDKDTIRRAARQGLDAQTSGAAEYI